MKPTIKELLGKEKLTRWENIRLKLAATDLNKAAGIGNLGCFIMMLKWSVFAAALGLKGTSTIFSLMGMLNLVAGAMLLSIDYKTLRGNDKH